MCGVVDQLLRFLAAFEKMWKPGGPSFSYSPSKSLIAMISRWGGGASDGYFIYFNGLRTSGEMSGSSGAEQSADFHFKRPV